jgi:hypothetical protein
MAANTLREMRLLPLAAHASPTNQQQWETHTMLREALPMACLFICLALLAMI